MRCSKCGSDNPAGKKFCGDRGAPLANHCPKCGAENPPSKTFCGEWGAELLEQTAQGAKVPPVVFSAGGERRHLTVLFCDVAGSSEIAAQLDPEQWREFVARYHRAAAEAITRYSGHVAKYLGDSVIGYFGWPEAHKNDAEGATRAGLGILEEVSRLNQQSTHPKVSVRVGVDSGSVVVGAGAGKDTDVFGEAPNIAARLQVAAAPDTVLPTASTHRLGSGLFVVEELGPQKLKGVANPVELYRVLRPTAVRGRLAAARGPTPFVGRQEELRLLLSRWETKDKARHLFTFTKQLVTLCRCHTDETPVRGRALGWRLLTTGARHAMSFWPSSRFHPISSSVQIAWIPDSHAITS